MLKRDAVAKVVLNNLYKHTQLQDTFGVNMLAIVDGVPRTLRLDEMIRYYVAHQVDVIVRRTRFQLRKAHERLHVLEGLLVALDHLDEVIALIRNSESADVARGQLMERVTSSPRSRPPRSSTCSCAGSPPWSGSGSSTRPPSCGRGSPDLEGILAGPERQRQIIGEELGEVVDKFGDERRTRIVPFEGEMALEDLIAQEDVVVTVTRGGYAKRTKTDLYRSQRRGGKGVQGAHAARGRHRRALLRDDHASLAAVLHEQGPRLPGEGARAAGAGPDRPRSARRQHPGVPAGRADRRGHRDQGLRRLRRTSCWPPAGPGEEDGAD